MATMTQGRQTAAVEERSTYVLSVIKAFALLETIAAAEDGLTLAEISKHNKLHASTAHRLLQTLIEIGYVRQDTRDRRYHLGARTHSLASSGRRHTTIESAALPLLRRLADQVEESAQVYVLDGMDVVMVAQAEPSKANRWFASVGGRMSAHCTAGGKVMLAYLAEEVLGDLIEQFPLQECTTNTITHPDDLRLELDRVRRRGYAIDDAEQELGVRCVAAAVRDHAGTVIAAMSVTGSTARIGIHRLPDLAHHIQEAAAALSRELGYRE